jgi:mono/diheme cytochrome c family protein
MKRSHPPATTAGTPPPESRVPGPERAFPAREIPRMHTGRLPPLSPRRLALAVAAVGLGLVALPGCNADKYDDALAYPVRSDLVVAGIISQIQPAGFNPPGRTPTDALRLPEREVTTDVNELRKELDKNIFDPLKLPADRRAEYATIMTEMFGTPARPKVAGFDPEMLKKVDENLKPETIIQTLDVGEEKLAQGSKLYRHHCLHCHGLEGNGRGPTGFWVNPHPRDYRQGTFKFTSSAQELGVRKPRREDLRHVVVQGIEGTSMPSFGLLPPADVDAIISYVIHLSLRGEVEYQTMLDYLKNNQPKPLDIVEGVQNPTLKQSIQEYLTIFVNDWMTAQKPETAIQPDPYPYEETEEAFLASAARGAGLFLTGDGSCISCHKNYGREAPYSYDVWGTVVRPRNNYDGVYRGGKRPIDLYYRVYAGIKGVGMTSYDKILRPNDEEKAKKVDRLWDVVNFMRALPYPELRSKLKEQYKVNIPD